FEQKRIEQAEILAKSQPNRTADIRLEFQPKQEKNNQLSLLHHLIPSIPTQTFIDPSLSLQLMYTGH
ncbi:hypothetical protein OFM52_30290, partial [Escherichia coli]|nr:hypothetical protein [Escherichia coli]